VIEEKKNSEFRKEENIEHSTFNIELEKY